MSPSSSGGSSFSITGDGYRFMLSNFHEQVMHDRVSVTCRVIHF